MPSPEKPESYPENRIRKLLSRWMMYTSERLNASSKTRLSSPLESGPSIQHFKECTGSHGMCVNNSCESQASLGVIRQDRHGSGCGRSADAAWVHVLRLQHRLC